MTDPSRAMRTERGLDRLVNFSDAVTAIAITLIVLPLVDGIPATDENIALTTYFHQTGYALTAAGISFLSIAGFWRDHHRLYERTSDYSGLLIRLNFVWLALIAFLPVATALLVHQKATAGPALALYLGTIAATMAVLNLEELELLRAGLLTDARRPTTAELAGRWIPLTLRLLALGVALAFPAVGLWALLVTVVGGPAQWLIRRRAERSAAPSPEPVTARP